MNVLPGEPVPPGFEDEVNRSPAIQSSIDAYKGNALIGIEYTVELHEEDRREPGYICLLCDKRGDPRTVINHWTSYNHRMKYLEKHYPTAMREINPLKYKPNSHEKLILVAQNLAEAIEDHHGRLNVTVHSADDFRRLKTRITNEVINKFHYDERNGPNFVNVIDRTLWDARAATTKQMAQTLQITLKSTPKRSNEELNDGHYERGELDEISSDDENSDIPKKQKKREQSPAYRVLPRVRRSPPFEESRDDEKVLPSPKELSIQASHITQERYKWEKYRCMLEIQLKQMEKVQQDYEKNPEKHPLYPEEWKKFWNRRYKELQVEKKVDPNKHDYKPEWIVYWSKRMNVLFNEEVEKKKKEIKIKLNLPEDAEEKVDQLKEKYKVATRGNATSTSKNSNFNQHSDLNSKGNRKAITDVIDISDDEDQGKTSRQRRKARSTSRSISLSPPVRRNRHHERESERDYKHASRGRSRSRSPRFEEYDRYRRERIVSPPHPSGSRGYMPMDERMYYGSSSSSSAYARYAMGHGHYRGPPPHHYRVIDAHRMPAYERSPSPSKSKSGSVCKETEAAPDDDGPLTVITVLRLLTALEEHLGSMGPKVVDLLGKALSLEKVKANSADELLMNEDNCVFFETIKEKLKGILIADVLEDQQKVRAVKKTVRNIAAIIHQVNTKGPGAADNANEHKPGVEHDTNKHTPPKTQSKASIKDLPFDRQLVATKLAAALVKEGRDDVSTDEMDKLIFLFVLMVKLSKTNVEHNGHALRMKDLRQELNLPAPATTAVTTPLRLQTTPIKGVQPSIVNDIFDKEVTQSLEDDISQDASEKDSNKNDANASMLESLTDSDLQTLLQNFKHLSTEEQHHLIAHLKKLETADPVRVEKLRKFVNLSDGAVNDDTNGGGSNSNFGNNDNDTRQSSNSRSNRFDDDDSPTVSRHNKKHNSLDDDELDYDRRTSAGHNVTNPNKFSLDDEDEDDDYNFEDVFKAASSKIQKASEERMQRDSNNEPIVPVSSSPSALTFNRAGLNANLTLNDTQNLIANLMGSLHQNNANNSNKNTPNSIQTATSSSSLPTLNNKFDKRQQQQTAQQQFNPQQQTAPATGVMQPFAYQTPATNTGYDSGNYNPMANVGNQVGYYNNMSGYNNSNNNNNNSPYGAYPPHWNQNQQMPNIPPQQYGMPYNQMGYGSGYGPTGN